MIVLIAKDSLRHFMVMGTILFSSAVFFADSAQASGTLGEFIQTIGSNTDSTLGLVSFIAYLVGVLFAATGIYKLKTHVESGPQAVPLSDPLKMLFAGGLMLAIPTISGVVQATFGDQGASQDIGVGFNAAGGEGSTLDRMMVNFIQDSYVPFTIFLSFFCFIAGAVLLFVAIHRLTKTAQQGPQGPAGMGTIGTFVLSGILFSVAPSVGMIVETLFGSRNSMTEVEFMALSTTMGSGSSHAQDVLVSILAFMAIVGIISVIRGFFVLRGLAEGNQQMTMMSGLAHIIAGAILVNFGQFANIIQNTLGVTEYGVLFQ